MISTKTGINLNYQFNTTSDLFLTIVNKTGLFCTCLFTNSNGPRSVSIQVDVSSTSYYQSKEVKHAESLIFSGLNRPYIYTMNGVTNMLFLTYSTCLMRQQSEEMTSTITRNKFKLPIQFYA